MQEEEQHRKCEARICFFFLSDICFKKKSLRAVKLQSLYITGSRGLSYNQRVFLEP